MAPLKLKRIIIHTSAAGGSRLVNKSGNFKSNKDIRRGRSLPKEASIKYVRTEGGGGMPKSIPTEIVLQRSL